MIRTARTALSAGLLLGLAAPMAIAGHHEGGHAATQSQADIVETAVAAGQFETLAAALTAAGLVETLKGDGPFTVFAPTDAAFAALPAGTVESLLEPANRDKLRSILRSHVVAGRVTADQVMGMDRAETVQGESVSIRVDGDRVMVDGATVVKADVMAGNGVIHVVDAVLMPGN